MHIADFLDVTFNLLDGMYKPYKNKPSTTDYKTTTNIYKYNISNRLSNNSSNKQVFDISKGEYEKALRESGYENVSLIYTYKKDIK